MNRSLVIAVIERLRLGAVARRLLRLARRARAKADAARTSSTRRLTWYRELPKALRWRRAIARELRVARAPSVACGKRNNEAALVVMCLWQRPERLPHILQMLADQHITQGIRLVLWNNNPESAAEGRATVANFGTQGALSSVDYIDSPINLLGMARFIVIRAAVRDGYGLPFAITLDDDQDVQADFVSTLAARGGPDRVAGWWACSIHGTYWERVELQQDGERADYVGTGGAVWPVSMAMDLRFFRDIPLRYRMIEDLWASVWAVRKGWPLTKLVADVRFVLRERDQVYGIEDRKSAFYSYLQR